MRYEILGPLRVVDQAGASFISAPKLERLLGALLVRADHLVPTDQLFSEIWEDRPPRRATAGLYVYVSLLRKFLRRPGRPGSPIATRPAGYVLHLGADDLDAREFLRLAGLGREGVRRRRYEEAAASFDQALSLWRGPVLGDVLPGTIVEGFATWLGEERLECVEQLLDACLAVGRHREVVGRLYSLIAEHPLREAFYRQLMLALYRSDRRADALLVYQSASQRLERELGVEPCRSLQGVRQAILSADGRLDLVATG
jgi:DNA-binding SARP family transcriptional activator